MKLLRLSRNFGHQLAITAGMDHADGDAVVIMDADLQDPPEVDPAAAASAGARATRSSTPCAGTAAARRWSKRFLAAAFYKTFRRMANVDVPLDAGDFRLVDRKVIDALVAGARAAPLRARADLLGRLLAVRGRLRPRGAPRRPHQVPGVEVDAARLGRDHVVLQPAAALDDGSSACSSRSRASSRPRGW